MKALPTIAAVAALIAVSAAGAAEPTAAQKRGWADYAEGIAKTSKKMGELCGKTFTAAYDQKSYPAFDPNTDMTRGSCEAGISSLRDACKDPSLRQGVQAISTLTCRHSTGNTGIERNGSELIFNINPKSRRDVKLRSGKSSSWENALFELL